MAPYLLAAFKYISYCGNPVDVTTVDVHKVEFLYTALLMDDVLFKAARAGKRGSVGVFCHDKNSIILNGKSEFCLTFYLSFGCISCKNNIKKIKKPC